MNIQYTLQASEQRAETGGALAAVSREPCLLSVVHDALRILCHVTGVIMRVAVTMPILLELIT